MSSITVSTTAGIHHKHNHNTPGQPANTDPITWVIVGVICLVILVRGAIKTFK